MRHTRVVVTHYGGPDALRVVEEERPVVPYSIQTFKRLKPEAFRQDLIALLDLLQQRKIKPLVAQRFLLPRPGTRRSCSRRAASPAGSCSSSTGDEGRQFYRGR